MLAYLLKTIFDCKLESIEMNRNIVLFGDQYLIQT